MDKNNYYQKLSARHGFRMGLERALEIIEEVGSDIDQVVEYIEDEEQYHREKTDRNIGLLDNPLKE